MSVARQVIADEHELYPVHEEDSVPEKPEHEFQVWALRSALRARFPEYWVTGETCMYWEERAFNRYVAPDVLVVGGPTPEDQNVYLNWADPPALLVIEVGSKSTFKEDEGPKLERYLLDLGVNEYVYFKPHRTAWRRSLNLWRLDRQKIVEVAPGRDGRLRLAALPLDLAVDETGRLRLYERGGEALPTPLDLVQQRDTERQRADAERQRADAERQRADGERRRAADLEREVQRLKAELERRGG